MARITLSEGRWAEMRPMPQKAENLIGDMTRLQETGDMAGYFRVKADMMAALDEYTIEASWEGGYGELPAEETLTAILSWNRMTDEVALPPTKGTSSETPSEPGSSPS